MTSHPCRAACFLAAFSVLVLADPASAADAACTVPEYGAPVLWMDERDVAPGQDIALEPVWTRMPGQFDPMPARCFTDWHSTLASAVISPDGTHVRIAASARHGETGTITARIGDRALVAPIRVVVAARAPLNGTWRQVDGTCTGAPPATEPIRELIFKGSGEFSLTFMPFEIYRDIWGTFHFDAAAGRLTLDVTGQNRDLGAKHFVLPARLDKDGKLILGGLGFDAGAPDCTRTFSR